MAKQFTGIGVVLVLATIGGLAGLGACNSGSVDAADCLSLTTCCDQLTNAEQKSGCDTVVTQGDPTTCGSAQATYEEAMLCTVSTGGGGGGGTGCAGLTTCCASVSAAEQPTCGAYMTIANGVDATCSTYLTTLQSAGMCASVGTGPGTGATGCAGLSSCCSSLDSTYEPSCAAEVSAGVDSSCSAFLTELKAASYCGGGTGTGPGTGTGGCATLSSCCSSLDSTYEPSCAAEVSAGVDSSCSAFLTELKAASYCGGGAGTGPGTGGTNCASLSSCCGTAPAADQASCAEVVNAGVDSTCSAELTAYTSAGYCGGTSTGTGGCATLSSCCPSLDSTYEPSCAAEVSAGVDSSCSEFLTELQAASYCGG